MFKMFAVGAGVALAATTGVTALTGAVSASSRPADPRADVVLTLTTRPVDAHWIDEGAPGTSLGDTVVFSDVVSLGGTDAGRDGGSCQVVNVGGGLPTQGGPAESWVATCSGTLDLAGGQITAQGLVGFTPDGLVRAGTLAAVTGGTGAYTGARGWLRVTPESGGRRTVVVTLVR
jgi:hypothetical protein